MSHGVSQGSVLGPLLFNNKYLNNLFFLYDFTDVCNFSDDTSLYACDLEFNFWIKRCEHDSLPGIEWIENNNMKLNQDKCHLLVCGHKNENFAAHIRNKKNGEVISRSC